VSWKAAIALGGATLLIGASVTVAGRERATLTVALGGSVSAGVQQDLRCTVIESAADDGQPGPVVSIQPFGQVWVFQGETLGRARVRCGFLGRRDYRVHVLTPARLEVLGQDEVEDGNTANFVAIGYDVAGRRISSDVKIDSWSVSGALEPTPVETCEFPPWCDGLSPGAYRVTATSPGEATLVASLGDLRATKRIRVRPSPPK
jgi:hypothetical protein